MHWFRCNGKIIVSGTAVKLDLCMTKKENTYTVYREYGVIILKWTFDFFRSNAIKSFTINSK